MSAPQRRPLRDRQTPSFELRIESADPLLAESDAWLGLERSSSVLRRKDKKNVKDAVVKLSSLDGGSRPHMDGWVG